MESSEYVSVGDLNKFDIIQDRKLRTSFQSKRRLGTTKNTARNIGTSLRPSSQSQLQSRIDMKRLKKFKRRSNRTPNTFIGAKRYV